MTLDPGMVWLLELVEKAGYPPLESLSVAEARRQYLATANKLDRAPAKMDSVGDFAVERPGAEPGETPAGQPGDLRVRIYRPRGAPSPAPALLWFHGGGWTVGSVETADAVCRGLAEGARCVVISVEYRMGPEAPFPAAIDDAALAWDWLAANAAPLGLDPARLAIGGDSAGGNLAAALAHLARNSAVAPAFQLLIYPATDMAGDYPSRTENARGYLLDDTTIAWFRKNYLADSDLADDPRASPLLNDDFGGLAPAHIQTAGYDPLRDEGIAYAGKLTGAGVTVDHRHYPGLMHGYFNMSGAIESADAAFGDAVRALAAALDSRPPA